MWRLKSLFLILWMGCADATLPTPTPEAEYPQRSCDTVITHDRSASIVGDFTDWQEVALEETESGWMWSGQLEPGAYGFRFISDGEPESTPPDTLSRWHEGQEVREVRVGDCELPEWEFSDIEYVDGVIRAKATFLSSATTKAKLDPASVVVLAGETSVSGNQIDILADKGEVSVRFVPEEPGKYSLRISGTDTDGVEAENNNLWLPVWAEETPFRWQDGVMYLAFTDRFRSARGMRPSKPDANLQDIASFMGGDFAGVTEAIREGYLTDLGVNILWLSPIYENPEGAYGGRDENIYTGYHGYWPIDPLSSETAYGGDEDLKELIAAAHEKGIRILFDIVLNHVHDDHTYCAEEPSWCEKTCVCGTQDCDWEGPNGRPLDCQFAPYLPDLNYRNPAVVDRVLEDVFELMARFDVDGLRIDAAKHMDHVIMRQMRLRLNEREASGIAPFYLVGETFTGDRGLIMDYVADYELHGQFDFPLYYAVRGAFAGNGSFRDLEGATAAGQRAYGSFYTWMSPFLGNHDIPRFATEAVGNGEGPFGSTQDLMANGPADTITEWNVINRASMAFAFVLTQPGVPLIYYGDEVGLAGDGDPDNRRMMPTTFNANQQELLRRVQELGRARRELPALRGNERKELWLEDSMYVYVRSQGSDVAIVAMNKGDTTRSEDVTIPSALGLAGKTMEVWGRDGLEASVIDGNLRIQLDPWEYRIIVPKE